MIWYKKINDNILFLGIVLILTISTVFAYTVYERRSWFGQMNSRLWLTGGTLKYSRNWFRDGAINDCLLMLEKPNSIENPEIKDRGIYLSYPAGAIIPIHLIATITSTEPSPKMVMLYNLFIHYTISITFAFMAFLAAQRLELKQFHVYVFSIMPALFYLLAPYPMAYHQNRYFADMAVLLPFAVVLLIEVFFATKDSSKKTDIILFVMQHFFFALGLFTDYLFVFVYASFYFKRLCLGEMGKNVLEILRKSAVYSFSCLIPIGVFLFQIFHFNSIDTIKKKFLFRTGSNSSGEEYITDFYTQFWEKKVAEVMGDLSVMIIFGSVIIVLAAVLIIILLKIKKRKSTQTVDASLFGICAIVLFSCIGQVYFLDNHSVIHNFSALKMAFLLAIIPFGILPLALVALGENFKKSMFDECQQFRFVNLRDKIFRFPILVFFILFFFATYIGDIHANFIPLIDKPQRRVEEFGYFLGNNTDYNDVVFSKTVSIAPLPPQIVGLSMKLVYKIDNIHKITDRIKTLPAEAVVNLLVDKKNNKAVTLLGGKSFWKNMSKIEDGNLILLKMKKQQFLDKVNSI